MSPKTTPAEIILLTREDNSRADTRRILRTDSAMPNSRLFENELNGRVGGGRRNVSGKREQKDAIIFCNAFNTKKKIPNHETLRDTPNGVSQ